MLIGPSRPAMVDLRQLRYFLAVADELHFGHAAERLHMAQPPLSQAIRKLEANLGVRLLDRDSRSVSLTEPGRVFAEEARRVLADVDFAVGETRRAAVDPTTIVRIGCAPPVPIARLHRFLTGLREILPSVRPLVKHQIALKQVHDLRAGELDLGIFLDAGTHPEIETAPVFAGEPMMALVPTRHRLARTCVVSPEDMAGEPLVMFPRAANAGLHDRILGSLAAAGYRQPTVLAASGPDQRDVALAVADGLGVALVPATQEADVERMVLTKRPLNPGVMMPDTLIAWRANPPRQARDVLGSVRALADNLHRATTAERDRSGEADGS